MKINIASKLIAGLLLCGGANAATITVTSGLPAQGITPYLDGGELASFFVAVGNWDGTTFTQFGSSLADTAKVNGAFTATGPESLNGSLIAVFVGTGENIAASGTTWAIFTSTNNTAFPADVTAATGVTFSMTLPSVLNVAAKGDEAHDFVGNNFNFVLIPEPSVAILGGLGLLGLMRRRR